MNSESRHRDQMAKKTLEGVIQDMGAISRALTRDAIEGSRDWATVSAFADVIDMVALAHCGLWPHDHTFDEGDDG